MAGVRKPMKSRPSWGSAAVLDSNNSAKAMSKMRLLAGLDGGNDENKPPVSRKGAAAQEELEDLDSRSSPNQVFRPTSCPRNHLLNSSLKQRMTMTTSPSAVLPTAIFPPSPPLPPPLLPTPHSTTQRPPFPATQTSSMTNTSVKLFPAPALPPAPPPVALPLSNPKKLPNKPLDNLQSFAG